MIERYGRVAMIGLALGAGLGAALYGVFVLGGNPVWRRYLGVEEIVRSALGFALAGSLVACASCVGSLLALVLCDRRLEKAPAQRLRLVSAGAAGGTLMLGAVVATVQLGGGGASWAALTMGITIAVALCAALIALLLAAEVERRAPVWADR